MLWCVADRTDNTQMLQCERAGHGQCWQADQFLLSCNWRPIWGSQSSTRMLLFICEVIGLSFAGKGADAATAGYG